MQISACVCPVDVRHDGVAYVETLTVAAWPDLAQHLEIDIRNPHFLEYRT